MNYVELHLHDHYSALDGLNTPEEYMKRAKEIGMTHLAQTNHGTLAGHREFQKAAKDAGIVPILGVEAYISETDRFDKRGQGVPLGRHVRSTTTSFSWLRTRPVCVISTSSTRLAGPRVSTTSRVSTLTALEEYSDDLIILSGCLNSIFARR
jgi:DNA polymerase-3 subunit alpha